MAEQERFTFCSVLVFGLSLFIESQSGWDKLLFVLVGGTELKYFGRRPCCDGGEELVLGEGIASFSVASPVVEETLLKSWAVSNPPRDDFEVNVVVGCESAELEFDW